MKSFFDFFYFYFFVILTARFYVAILLRLLYTLYTVFEGIVSAAAVNCHCIGRSVPVAKYINLHINITIVLPKIT